MNGARGDVRTALSSGGYAQDQFDNMDFGRAVLVGGRTCATRSLLQVVGRRDRGCTAVLELAVRRRLVLEDVLKTLEGAREAAVHVLAQCLVPLPLQARHRLMDH